MGLEESAVRPNRRVLAVRGLGFEAVDLADRIRGVAPAGLKAVTTAKHMALNRAVLEAKQVPPLIWYDFEEAI